MINFLSFLRRRRAYTEYFKQMETTGEYSTAAELAAIRAPVLVITGSEDKIVSAVNSEILAAGIPGASLIIVDGGSHAFFLEMSGRFNREVWSFLDEKKS